jgi:hypothetical protein
MKYPLEKAVYAKHTLQAGESIRGGGVPRARKELHGLLRHGRHLRGRVADAGSRTPP